MSITTGSSPLARSFANIEPVGGLTVNRFLVLLGMGILLVVLEQAFRFPLRVPGHHGLEGMAVLCVARLLCTHRWAATISAAAAAATAVAIGAGHGVLTPVFYLLPGLALDLIVGFAPRWRQVILALPILAAGAHATKPLLRWLLAETAGLEFGSLSAGPLYPVATHLVFGFVGGLLATMAWRHWQRVAKHGPGYRR